MFRISVFVYLVVQMLVVMQILFYFWMYIFLYVHTINLISIPVCSSTLNITTIHKQCYPKQGRKERGKEMCYQQCTQHNIFMAMWRQTIQIVREENCCCHYMDSSFWLAAKDLLYVPSHSQALVHQLCQ